jgi:beta-lactamase class A
VLFAAGAYSSNVAAKMLLSLTTHESLATESDLLGMTNTHLFVDPTTLPNWPPAAAPDSSDADIAAATAFDLNDAANGTTNLTTPADIAHYFQLLLDGKIVSRAASEEILDILKTQMVDNRFPVLLPAGTEMAHKTGDLDHVVHDAGVIYAPDGPVILVSMAEGDSNDDIPIEIEQRLALIAYGDLDIPPIDLAPEEESGNAGAGNETGGNESDGNISEGNAIDGGADDGNAG